MPLTKNLGGEIVDLTPEEEQAFRDEWALNDAKPKPTAGDDVVTRAAGDPFVRAMVKLLAAQSTQIFGAPRTVPQVIAILKALA